MQVEAEALVCFLRIIRNFLRICVLAGSPCKPSHRRKCFIMRKSRPQRVTESRSDTSKSYPISMGSSENPNHLVQVARWLASILHDSLLLNAFCFGGHNETLY